MRLSHPLSPHRVRPLGCLLGVLLSLGGASCRAASTAPGAPPAETSTSPGANAPVGDAGAASTAPSAPRHYAIYRGTTLVLDVEDRSGPLISTALPPPTPGWTPPVHPFLSGVAHDAASESALRDVLDQSRSFDDFLARLRAAGFRTEELDAGAR